MRNLQKILALVMAMVMSFSLLATVNAADFPDAGEISETYSDAVTVLNGLKVFQGYKEDGTFRPKGNITRAEVAAIIYRIVTGDVDDTQKDIYSSWGKFNDVLDGSWYAGYVNYCANAGYIKGYNNTTFGPNDQVTGYQALAMILRAVGYDKNGEFTGSQWQIRTASIARERGVTKNVTDTLLGQAATRETVAELLFRSIIIPKVDFNANTLSYTVRGQKETLGYESLKLEEVTGIVTANEYADLENTKVLNSGKTRMTVKVDNKDTKYTLDYSEGNLLDGLDAIGEEHNAYIQNANTTSAKVLVMAKTDKNKTYETLEKKDIKSDSDFRSVTGLQRGNEVETKQFINFSEESGAWKSDWRIKYVVSMPTTATGTALDALEAERLIKRAIEDGFDLPVLPNGGVAASDNYRWAATKDTKYPNALVYTQEFKINDEIGSRGRTNIEKIFNIADKYETGYIDGEVYAGTSSLKDVSDIMSLKQFKDEYIKVDDTVKIEGNEYGNWLKVIDNDNDGQADYVLKILYTMAQVVRAKDAKYGLDTEDRILHDSLEDTLNHLNEDNVKSEDTLVLDDIVYYAVIDDVPWATKAEVVTAKIDTVNRKDETATTTDGTTYNQSGVCEEIVSNDYSSKVVNLNGSATYDLYLDRGGYLAAFSDSHGGDFTLIVDGWYNETKSAHEYAVRAYNDETKRQDVVDVTRGGSLFISGDVEWDRYKPVQNNDWRALKWLGGTADNDRSATLDTSALDNIARKGQLNGESSTAVQEVKTTVATLADGVLQPVDYSTIGGNKTIRMLATKENKIPTASASYDAKVYRTSNTSNDNTAYNDEVTANAEVRALSTTVYYVVYPARGSESGFAVERYVGYSDVPGNVKDSGAIEDVYAVGTKQERVSTLGRDEYYTANVVVIELNSNYKGNQEQVFIYNLPVVRNGVTIEGVDLIHENGTREEDVQIDFEKSRMRDYNVADSVRDNWSTWGPGLYYMYPTNTEKVYTVQPMYAEDIAKTDYVVGWSATSYGTVGANYVDVLAFNGKDTDGNRFNDEINIAYDMIHKNVNRSECTIYTLSYDGKGMADLGVYDATEGNLQRFMDERTDVARLGDRSKDYNYDHNGWGVTNDNYVAEAWNQNRVLVHYDGNNAKYAISFSNKMADGALARAVWNQCLPQRDDSKWAKEWTPVDFARALTEVSGSKTNSAWTGTSYVDTIVKAANAVKDLTSVEAKNALDDLNKILEAYGQPPVEPTSPDVTAAIENAESAITLAKNNKTNNSLSTLASALDALKAAGVSEATIKELTEKAIPVATEAAKAITADGGEGANDVTKNALQTIANVAEEAGVTPDKAFEDVKAEVDTKVPDDPKPPVGEPVEVTFSVTDAIVTVNGNEIDSDTLTNTFSFESGKPVTFKAVPATGFDKVEITGVTATATENADEYTFTPNADVTVTVKGVTPPPSSDEFEVENGEELDLTGHKKGETVKVTVTNADDVDLEEYSWYEVFGGIYVDANYAAAKINSDKSTEFSYTLAEDDEKVTFTLRELDVISGGNGGTTLTAFDENGFRVKYTILRVNQESSSENVNLRKMARAATDTDGVEPGQIGSLSAFAYSKGGNPLTTFYFVGAMNPRTKQIGEKLGGGIQAIKQLIAEAKEADKDEDDLPVSAIDEVTEPVKGMDGGEKGTDANGDPIDATRVEETPEGKINRIVLGLGQPKAEGAKLPTELEIDGVITVKITWFHDGEEQGPNNPDDPTDPNVYAIATSNYTYKVRIVSVTKTDDGESRLDTTVEIAKADVDDVENGEEEKVAELTGDDVQDLEDGRVVIDEENNFDTVELITVTVNEGDVVATVDEDASILSVEAGESAKIVVEANIANDEELHAYVGEDELNVTDNENGTYTIVVPNVTEAVTVDLKAEKKQTPPPADEDVEMSVRYQPGESDDLVMTIAPQEGNQGSIDASGKIIAKAGVNSFSFTADLTGTVAATDKFSATLNGNKNSSTVVLSGNAEEGWKLSVTLEVVAGEDGEVAAYVISKDETQGPPPSGQLTVNVTVDSEETFPATKGEGDVYTATFTLDGTLDEDSLKGGTTAEGAVWSVAVDADTNEVTVTIDTTNVVEGTTAVVIPLTTEEGGEDNRLTVSVTAPEDANVEITDASDNVEIADDGSSAKVNTTETAEVTLTVTAADYWLPSVNVEDAPSFTKGSRSGETTTWTVTFTAGEEDIEITADAYAEVSLTKTSLVSDLMGYTEEDGVTKKVYYATAADPDDATKFTVSFDVVMREAETQFVPSLNWTSGSPNVGYEPKEGDEANEYTYTVTVSNIPQTKVEGSITGVETRTLQLTVGAGVTLADGSKDYADGVSLKGSSCDAVINVPKTKMPSITYSTGNASAKFTLTSDPSDGTLSNWTWEVNFTGVSPNGGATAGTITAGEFNQATVNLIDDGDIDLDENVENGYVDGSTIYFPGDSAEVKLSTDSGVDVVVKNGDGEAVTDVLTSETSGDTTVWTLTVAKDATLNLSVKAATTVNLKKGNGVTNEISDLTAGDGGTVAKVENGNKVTFTAKMKEGYMPLVKAASNSSTIDEATFEDTYTLEDDGTWTVVVAGVKASGQLNVEVYQLPVLSAGPTDRINAKSKFITEYTYDEEGETASYVAKVNFAVWPEYTLVDTKTLANNITLLAAKGGAEIEDGVTVVVEKGEGAGAYVATITLDETAATANKTPYMNVDTIKGSFNVSLTVDDKAITLTDEEKVVKFESTSAKRTVDLVLNEGYQLERPEDESVAGYTFDKTFENTSGPVTIKILATDDADITILTGPLKAKGPNFFVSSAVGTNLGKAHGLVSSSDKNYLNKPSATDANGNPTANATWGDTWVFSDIAMGYYPAVEIIEADGTVNTKTKVNEDGFWEITIDGVSAGETFTAEFTAEKFMDIAPARMWDQSSDNDADDGINQKSDAYKTVKLVDTDPANPVTYEDGVFKYKKTLTVTGLTLHENDSNNVSHWCGVTLIPCEAFAENDEGNPATIKYNGTNYAGDNAVLSTGKILVEDVTKPAGTAKEVDQGLPCYIGVTDKNDGKLKFIIEYTWKFDGEDVKVLCELQLDVSLAEDEALEYRADEIKELASDSEKMTAITEAQETFKNAVATEMAKGKNERSGAVIKTAIETYQTAVDEVLDAEEDPSTKINLTNIEDQGDDDASDEIEELEDVEEPSEINETPNEL